MAQRSGQAMLSTLFQAIICVVAAQLLAVPLMAQHVSNQGVTFSGTSATPPSMIPRFPDQRVVLDKGNQPPEQRIEDGCFLPPLTITHTALVDTTTLQAPLKAQGEYHSACAAVKDQKWADAEKHLRKAVEQYPKYSAAWVTLGQILEASQKNADARKACTQATVIESTYLPAHLCLADIAAHEQNWELVLKSSQRALELNPTSDPHAYFYAASAYLKLNQLPEAEKNALRAVDIDKQNVEPRAHFLLAQIYEMKGDSTQELAQLREYLKFVADPNDAAMVKKYVAALEAKAAR
jgi:tetratricopeptide (TPR) repeat protein